MLELGKKIRSLRQAKEWSQGDVAAKLGISVSAFSKIEKDITDISISRIEQLAQLFDISLAELILPQGEQGIDYQSQLRKANETIDKQSLKIIGLQEYVISLYEMLQENKQNPTINSNSSNS
jgi:transcriptional regulator with XRE-family HTH domain